MEPKSPKILQKLHSGHPRPHIYRAPWTSLNGKWQFSFAPGTNSSQPVAADFDFSDATQIAVPFPPGSPLSGVTMPPEPPATCWYQRTIDVADLPEGATQSGNALLLHFESVEYICDVWVNGQHRVTHQGGYTPFTVAIPANQLTQSPTVTITVCTQNLPADTARPRGKQDWRAEPHGIWYKQSLGIWRDVWCEVVSDQNYVQALNYVFDRANSRLTVEVEMANPFANPVSASIALSLAGQELACVQRTVSSQDWQLTFDLDFLQNPMERGEYLWSPSSPTLLDVDIQISDAEGRTLDHLETYAGLRDTEVQDGYFTLNGVPVFVRGVLEQGYWEESYFTAPSVQAIEDEVRLTLNLGFNMARLHEHTADQRFLAWADVLGLMLWAEAPSAYDFNARAVQRTTAEWMQIIRRDRPHPSVVTWVPLNESWGIWHVASRHDQQQFLKAMVSLTRALDPTRPVVGNDGWEQLDSDIVTLHDYGTQGDHLLSCYQTEAATRQTLAGLGPQGKRTTLEEPASHAAIMVSEFGGIALAEPAASPAPAPAPDVATWGYDVARDPKQWLDQLTELFQALYASPTLSGFCYTQLTDTRQEANGLCDAARRPKVPIEQLRRMITDDDAHNRQIRPRVIVEMASQE